MENYVAYLGAPLLWSRRYVSAIKYRYSMIFGAM